MPQKKLSEIDLALAPPALTDMVVGVDTGNFDLRWTLEQLQSTISAGTLLTVWSFGALGVPDAGLSRIQGSYIGVGNGTAGDFSGSLKLTSLDIGQNVLLGSQAPSVGTWSLTFPPDGGTNGYVLNTDGTGVTSWVSIPTGGAATLTVGSSTISSGVDGSVLFQAGGVLQEDATNFFWDNTNKRLGIGTNTPTSIFEIIDPLSPIVNATMTLSTPNDLGPFFRLHDGVTPVDSWFGASGTYFWWSKASDPGFFMISCFPGSPGGGFVSIGKTGVYSWTNRDSADELLDGNTDTALSRIAPSASLPNTGSVAAGSPGAEQAGGFVAHQLTSLANNGTTTWDSFRAYAGTKINTASTINFLSAASGATPHGVCYSTTAKYSGKWAFSIPSIFIGTGDVGFGFAVDYSADGGANSLGSGNQVAVFTSGAVVFSGAPTGEAGDVYAQGDVLDFAVNMDAQLWWYRVNGGNWNANALADPATDTGGFSLHGLTSPLRIATDLSDAFATANFAPSLALTGYSNWSTGASNGALFFSDGAGRVISDPEGLTWENKILGVSGLVELKAIAVAELPGSPVLGMEAVVDDALAPVVGTPVASGGVAAAKVWYNGAAWNVFAV